VSGGQAPSGGGLLPMSSVGLEPASVRVPTRLGRGGTGMMSGRRLRRVAARSATGGSMGPVGGRLDGAGRRTAAGSRAVRMEAGGGSAVLFS
jgi:hypothetical protein